MAPEPKTQEKASVSEPDAVIAWRQEELIRAGFSHDHAQVLAACPDIDLRMAIRLIEKGCDHSMAFLILI